MWVDIGASERFRPHWASLSGDKDAGPELPHWAHPQPLAFIVEDEKQTL